MNFFTLTLVGIVSQIQHNNFSCWWFFLCDLYIDDDGATCAAQRHDNNDCSLFNCGDWGIGGHIVNQNIKMMATKLLRSAGAALRMHHRIASNAHARALHITVQLDRNVDFHLSDIGEGIREVIIKEWFVKEGDVVEQFDNLCEVQSDKASVTITSRYDGKIIKLYHNIDDIALVGKPLIAFDVVDEAGHATETADKAQPPASDTTKTTTTNATASAAAAQTQSDVRSYENSQTNTIESQTNGRRIVLTTPAVRRIATENNVNLSNVTPTGKLGRVLKSDVLEFLNILPSTIEQNRPVPVNTSAVDRKASPATASPKIPTAAAGDRVEKLKGVRKIMLKTMTEALKIPHFIYSDEVDVTKLVQLRQTLKPHAAAHDIKLTFMPFFIKAASLALLQFPILNSSLDVFTESVVYKAAHNISVAMDTPDGLVVPNIKNCEAKTIVQIANDLKELHVKGQKGQLTPDDFANGTFTLSNIGVVGGTYTAPTIMTPQVSIGGIGTTRILPRFGPNDVVVKAHVLNISWACDHRVIDGVSAASFSNEWKRYLENPELFVLQ